VPPIGAIVPHLVVRSSAEAVDIYVRDFSAKVLYRSSSPSGAGEHLHLKMWSSLVQLSSEEPNQKRRNANSLASPETLGASICVFQGGVPDVDAAYQRAVESGAISSLPPTDMFWGDRYGWIRDPFGHVWALSTVKEVLTPQQIEDRLRGFAAQMKGQKR